MHELEPENREGRFMSDARLLDVKAESVFDKMTLCSRHDSTAIM